MPQIDLIPIKSNVFWLIIFFCIYLYIYITYYVYPIVNSLKINYYIIFKKLSTLRTNLHKESIQLDFVLLLDKWWEGLLVKVVKSK